MDLILYSVLGKIFNYENYNWIFLISFFILCLVIFDYYKSHLTRRAKALNIIPGAPILPFIGNANLLYGPEHCKLFIKH